MRKNIKPIVMIMMLVACLICLSSCMPPVTFVKTLEPTWFSIEIRPDIEFEDAWDSVVDTLTKRFDMAVLSRKDGYMRTTWLYSWTGAMSENYRVRVTVKFSPDRAKCNIKTEAEYGGAGTWIMGYDSRLLRTVKTDIMGAIGRTTR